MKKKIKILLAGGGTGGHIFPLIAISREIKRKYPDEPFQFLYLGPKDDFAKELFEKEEIKSFFISSGKIRRYFSFLNIIDIFFKIPLGLLQAFYYIYVLSPDLIFSKGGYGSVPVVLMGRLFFTPIFIHESDVYPGLSNQISSRFAMEVFISFPIRENSFFPPNKIISVGNPIRKEVLEGDKGEIKIKGGKPVVFIMGGSQGAQKINDVILVILEEMLKEFEVIHQTGKKNFEQIKKETIFLINEDLREFYHPFGFLNDRELSSAYNLSDIIISRAGATAIFEIASVRKPSILIPLSNSANMHQYKNAYTYAKNGASIVIEEDNFTPYFFIERLRNLFKDKIELDRMAKKTEDFSNPNAASIISEYIVSYLKK